MSDEPKVKEYGLLYYDIPSNNMGLYHKVKKLVNRTCLPVNLSVYVFEWGLKTTIENRLQSINAYNGCCINMIKFDTSTAKELEEIATHQLEIVFQKMHKRIQTSIANATDNIKKQAVLDRVTAKLNEYESLMTLYEFTKRAESSLKVLRDVIQLEYTNLK